MAMVSKAEAARIAGVSRTTIHRYVKQGKISAVSGDIETAELMRVFGDLSLDSGEQVEQSSGGEHPVTQRTGRSVTSSERKELQDRITQLEALVSDLKRDKTTLQREKDDLMSMLKTEQERGRLLEYHTTKTWAERIIEAWKGKPR